MIAHPVRLQLSRKKGFNLQELSTKTNGLRAARVARPSKWGNPFSLSAMDRTEAVRRFAAEIGVTLPVEELRGMNLACWCKPSQLCHADALLKLANR
jgi:hypothetical protein